MTKKRFSHKKWYDDRQLFDGDEPFAIVDVYIQAEAICNKLNELHEKKEILVKEVMDGDAQYRLDTAEQLKKHYNYAIQQMNKNIDDIIVYEAYNLLRASIKDIAKELGVELE